MSLVQTSFWSISRGIVNNIVAFNSSGVMFQSSQPYGNFPPTLTACNVYGNTAYDYSGWTQPPTGTNGNISADPLFVDTEAGDYHIRPDSPCRDAGNGVSVSPEDRDIDGQRRLFGANPDIGADEIPTAGVPLDVPLVYVSLSGDDANDGTTWATAKRHVYAALDVVRSPGGEVWVAAGRYTESVVVWPGVALYGGFAGTETTREARDPATNVTVLDGSSITRSSVAILARDNVFSGFTVTGGVGGIVAIHPGGTSRIEGNVITNNSGTGGIGVGGGSFVIRDNVISGNQQAIFGRIADVRIERNRIYGNEGRPGGILLSQCQAQLSDNLIYGNVGGGVRLSETTATITNNTIVRNFGCHRYADGIAEYPIAGGVSSDSSSMTLVNNIIAFNTGGVYEKAPSAVLVLRNNCVYGNDWYDWNLNNGGVPTGQYGNISADPHLAETSTGNLHIQPDSPCRDAGDPTVAEAGALDMDGQPRIQGTTVDIGADESDGTVWAPVARVVRVSPAGSDDSDGSSWVQAMKTAQAAIDRAAATGGEVWVAAGTYTGNLTLPAYVRLYGGFAGTEEQREQRDPVANVTILDANGSGTVLVVEPMGLFTAVDGFTVRNGIPLITPAVGGLACMRGSSVQIANNLFTANSGGTESAILVESAWADIRRNVIKGNGRPNAQTLGSVNLTYALGAFEENTVTSNTSGGGLYLVYAAMLISRNTIAYNSDSGGIWSSISTCDITQNVIRNNSGEAGGLSIRGSDRVVNNLIAGNTGQWGGGIQLQSQDATVANNTIVSNTALYNGGGIYVAGYRARVANNIIAYNNSGLYCDNAALPETFRHVITHNDLFGNTAYNSTNLAAEYGAALNFSEDPLFVDRAAGDLHLLPGSPCIDRGDSQYVRPGDLDIVGQARILGAAVDVGADEFLATGPSMADVVRALRLAGGLDTTTTEDGHLDSGVAGVVMIDLLDALHLARQHAGLENRR